MQRSFSRWFLIIVLILSIGGLAMPAQTLSQTQNTLHAHVPSDPSDVAQKTPTSRYIIQFHAPPLIAKGTVASRQQQQVVERQNKALQRLEQQLGHPLKLQHRYTRALNGVAVDLLPDEQTMLARHPEVAAIYPEEQYQIHTDVSPELVKADQVWAGTSGIPGTKGEGIIVGVLDTGINFAHPAFASTGGDGYTHTNPFGSGVYRGFCDPSHPKYNVTYACNDKLIGAWSWPESGNTPVDDNSHGSHTASTAAGNILTSTLLMGHMPYSATAGIAPHANIIAYDVCINQLGCSRAAILAAIDQAMTDGVDVINYSIGGPAVDPWGDPVALAFLNARAADIFVAVSAGNEGEFGPGTVSSPANAPWLTAVAASTHGRDFGSNALVAVSGGSTTPPTNLVAGGYSGGTGPRLLLDSADYTNPNASDPNYPCYEPYPAGTFINNPILLCNHDHNPFVMLRISAEDWAASGVAGVIWVNTFAHDPHVHPWWTEWPMVNVSFDTGQQLRTWLTSGSNHLIEIIGVTRELNQSEADIVTSFSSRGPNIQAPDILKPDLSAPGEMIIAAGQSSSAVIHMSGTSMASPHVAGAAALLKSMHPTWSATEIQSALMTTAVYEHIRSSTYYSSSLIIESAESWDMGSGRIDILRAAQAGLLLDQPAAGFSAANPNRGGQPTELNLASLSAGYCIELCHWSRTFTNPLTTSVTWTITSATTAALGISVTPSSFTIPANGSQTIHVTATTAMTATNVWYAGRLVLTPDQASIPSASLPISVRPMRAKIPNQIQIKAYSNSGSYQLVPIESIATNQLTMTVDGLVPATITTQAVSQTNVYPHIAIQSGGAFTVPITMTADTHYIVAQVVASEAHDADVWMYLDGLDRDGYPENPPNGIIDHFEALSCQGTTKFEHATPGFLDRCALYDGPEGTYWALIHNFPDFPTPSTDLAAIRVATAAVEPGDLDNLDSSLPTSVNAREPYTITLDWNLPNAVPGQRWYGMLLLSSDPATPGDLGSIPISIERTNGVWLPIIQR